MEQEYMKRVYNAFIVTLFMQLIFTVLFIISIYSNIFLLYWLSIILTILNLVPITGGLNIIYNHRKDEAKEKEQ